MIIIVFITAIAAAFDASCKKIPNWILLAGLLIWSLAAASGNIEEMPKNIIAATLIALFLILIRNLKPNRKLLGAGDIKLIFLIVLFEGLDIGLNILLFSFMAALLEAVLLILFFQKNKNYKMALAPAIFIGVITNLLIGGVTFA